MNYLIAIDSDGTLRKTDGSVSAFTKDVIKRVQEKQNIVLIATARPRYHTLELSNEIGINDYFISSNGAEVFDIKNNNVIYANYISKNDCLKVYNETKNLGLRAMFVYDNTEYLPFEDILMPVPSGYDTILYKQYGDYMEPAKTPTMHGGFAILDTEKSYKIYLPLIRKKAKKEILQYRISKIKKILAHFY